MFQKDPITFNRLKALSMRKRMDVIRSPDVGPGLFTALTPTDLASLFPTYYKKILPDVDGFRRAISAQSAKDSAAAAGKLEERLSAVEKSTASIMTPWAQRQRQASAPAQLSPEQAAAFQKVQQGAIGVNSPDAKFFSSLSTSQLASIGITKGKDNNGADVYQYGAPEVSREEAISRLKNKIPSGSFEQKTPAIMRRLQSEFNLTREEAAAVVGNLGHESRGFRDLQEKLSQEKLAAGWKGGLGWAQWTADRRDKFVAWSKSNGLDVSSDEANLGFLIHELKTSKSGAIQAVKNAKTPYDKMVAFEASFEAAGVKAYDSRFSYMQKALGTAPGESPSGPNGQYSEDQINKMIEQLKTEKTETRKHQLANLISSIQTQQGMPVSPDATAVVTGKMQYQNIPDFSKFALSGGVDNYTHMCGRGARVLAGHMYGHSAFLNEGIGGDATAGSLSRGNNYFQRSGMFKSGQSVSADQMSNQAYLDSLPIGTVVSSTGGRRGQGHAQIKIGPNQWASDTVQSHFLSRGYDNFVVHAPNEQGMAALAQNGVNQSSVEVPTTQPKQMAGEPPEAPPVAPPATPPSYDPEIPNATDNGGPTPTAVVQQPNKADYQQPQEALNAQAVKDIQAAPPPTSPNRFKVNAAGFVAAIRATEEFKSQAGIFAGAIPDSTILNGFNDDQRVKDAGVRYDPNTGVMTFKDPNDPRVKEVMRDFDTKKFMTPIEEKKKEAPKPKQQTEAPKETPKPVAPTAEVTRSEPAKTGEAPQSQPVAPPEPAPKQVQGYSDGGSFDMKGDTLNLYKVDKQDDMVAINPQTQEPVATLKSGEGITSGDSRVDVTPQSKTTDARPEPNPFNTMAQKVNNLENTMQTAIELANRPATKIEQMSPDTQTNHSNLIGDTNKMIVNQQKFSPSFDRAMHRTSRKTEPAGSFDHFSYGNK